MGQFGRLTYGGPDFDKEAPPDHLSVTRSGATYTYLQYQEETGKIWANRTCFLVFLVSTDGGDSRVIAEFDATTLSERIAAGAALDVPFFCLPYDWGDINHNYRPDIAVTFLWANNYTGGEVHIFEVASDLTVRCLTKDLPGPMSHWEFVPDSSVQMVIDPIWAEHDCLYPDSPFSFWLYRWDRASRSFVDVTAGGEYSFDVYLEFLESLLRPDAPFYPEGEIGPLVSILLLYDKSGQREAGWARFLELADEKNWPGTSEKALQWLRADVAHFRVEYEAGRPFTPNRAGLCEP